MNLADKIEGQKYRKTALKKLVTNADLPTPCSPKGPTMNLTDKIALVEEIIAMYHTTRMSDCPAAKPILSKPSVQKAFEALRAQEPPADVAGLVERCLTDAEIMDAVPCSTGFLLRQCATTITAQAAREARLRTALENAISEIEGGRLDERMCCDGYMCGCQGSSNSQFLVYNLRAALEGSVDRG